MTEQRALPFAWSDVRERLQARIFDLLPALGIHDRPKGGVVMPLNPTRAAGDERRPGSFVIWTSANAAGAWTDYATGDKGDVIDLVLYLKALRERIDAYWWSLEFLGLDRGNVRTAEAAELARREAERSRKAALADEAAAAERKAARLFSHWLTLLPIAGTLVETYLRDARGIPLDRLARPPGAIRFEPWCEHVDAGTGEITSWPCMTAVMTRGSKPSGLHRTWLAPDGSGKAPVAKPKKMFGRAGGAAIRLSSGPSGLSPGKAVERGIVGPLAIGEGIETCLTVAAAWPDFRVWAAGSLGNIGKLAWPKCATAVALLRDNDEGEATRAAFDRAADTWRQRAAGRPVQIVASAVGKDFNEWREG